MKNKTVKIVLYTLFAFFVSTGVSFGVTSYLYSPGNGGPITPIATPPSGSGLNIDPGEPKVAECPVNGEMFTKTEAGVWETRRPIVAMIENSVDSRPQSGLSKADIVYEAVAEGGITRFMGVFYCGIAAKNTLIAPVRSVRIYFANLAAEYNTPVFVHVGGANCGAGDVGKGTCESDKRVLALEALAKFGWRVRGGNDLDTIFDAGYPELRRDENRLGADRDIAVEHTMVGDTFHLYKEAETRGFTGSWGKEKTWAAGFDSWLFTDGKPSASPDAVEISFGFWDGYHDFDVKWVYDKQLNAYKRFMGGSPHLNLEDKEQITVSDVIVQYVPEIATGDKSKHLFYDVVGTGKALVFNNGTVTEATWKKTDVFSHTKFSDAKGKELEFVRGKMFVEIVPKGNSVDYN